MPGKVDPRDLRWGAKAMVLLVAVAVGVPFLVLSVAERTARPDAVADLYRLRVPASATFRLDAGRQVVYQEQSADAGGPQAVYVEVRGPDGQPLPTKAAGEQEAEYTHDGDHARAFLSFQVVEAGEHTVRTSGAGGVVVAVGPEVPAVGGLILTVAMVAMVGTLVVGSLLIARTAIRRSAAPADPSGGGLG